MLSASKAMEYYNTEEEKAFRRIEAIQSDWQQYGMVLPLVERAIKDRDAGAIQSAICACYMPFDGGDLDVVWPGSDIDTHFTAIRGNLKIIRQVRRERLLALEADA